MIDEEYIEQKIGEILENGMGIKWQDNPHLMETPKRVAKVYSEIYSGYDDDLNKYMKTFPAPKKAEENQIICIGPIEAYSVCSHHMLPFSMEIYVGYIPDEKILGISKFERISKSICRKLQVQENITEEIADFLNEKLEAKGVIVLIKNSQHLCMTMRGVQTNKASVSSCAIRGLFQESKVKNEFLKMIEK